LIVRRRGSIVPPLNRERQFQTNGSRPTINKKGAPDRDAPLMLTSELKDYACLGAHGSQAQDIRPASISSRRSARPVGWHVQALV
jgi:hypothetical protein